MEIAVSEAAARGEGYALADAELVRAILYNGLGQYDAALHVFGPAGRRRPVERRDRRAAVHQPAHGRLPPTQGVLQARHHLAQPTPAGTARDRECRSGGVAVGSAQPASESVAAWWRRARPIMSL